MKKWMFLIATIVATGSQATPEFNKYGNWGISSEGINSFKSGSTPSPDIVVGVVDTGIDFSHPDLKDSQWMNPGESGPWEAKNKEEALKAPDCFDKSCNQIDDDKNGFVDDVSGYDFIRKTGSKSEDLHGHGTHIAGIIGGKLNFEKGTGGVAPGVKISNYRYYENGSSTTNAMDLTIKSLKLAVSHNVKIINYSGGGTEPSNEEKKVLIEAEKKGILVIVAAGNESTDFSKGGAYYPCAYGLSNIICVGNLNKENQIPKSSNKGSKYIDVFAPGTTILSTAPGNTYSFLTGTSQSTAFITGLAALMYSKDPHLSFEEIKSVLTIAGNKNPLKSLQGQAKIEGKIDADLTLRVLSHYITLRDEKEQKTQSALNLPSKPSKYTRSISATDNSSSKKGE